MIIIKYYSFASDASPGRPAYCVFLPDLHTSLHNDATEPQTTLDLEHIKEAVFER